MNRKTIMSVPAACFWSVIAVCVLGIVIGSFRDFDINAALANKTDLGSFFATYGSYFSYCLYPAAGACLYVGLKKKGDGYRLLAWTLLMLGWFMAVYYSNSYNGKVVRALFGYTPGESSAALSVLSWLFWAVLYGWVPFVVIRLADNSNPDKLIAVGAAILIAGIARSEKRVPQLVADDPEPGGQRRQLQKLAQRQHDHRRHDVLPADADRRDEKAQRQKESDSIRAGLRVYPDLWL